METTISWLAPSYLLASPLLKLPFASVFSPFVHASSSAIESRASMRSSRQGDDDADHFRYITPFFTRAFTRDSCSPELGWRTAVHHRSQGIFSPVRGSRISLCARYFFLWPICHSFFCVPDHVRSTCVLIQRMTKRARYFSRIWSQEPEA